MKTSLNNVEAAINRCLSEHSITPVLVDVGASGAPPAIWNSFAKQSIYVGFDPDSRELRKLDGGHFHKALIVDSAVVSSQDEDHVKLFLTHSPYCSSTLQPDVKGLSNYIFSDLFVVEREVQVRATTLNAVIDELKLPGIDWLKLDTQGIDLRLYKSLGDDLRARVLAVDVEPGLIDAYIEEDLFLETHRALVREGFWLSDALLKGTVRMSRETLAEALKRQPTLNETTLTNTLKPAPGWCEARYLRSLESLASHDAESREYVLLWAIAILDGQVGFAFEVGLEFEKRFPQNLHSRALAAEALRLLPVKHQPPRLARLKTFVPASVRCAFKRVFF